MNIYNLNYLTFNINSVAYVRQPMEIPGESGPNSSIFAFKIMVLGRVWQMILRILLNLIELYGMEQN